jgi:hypothetical protein
LVIAAQRVRVLLIVGELIAQKRDDITRNRKAEPEDDGSLAV